MTACNYYDAGWCYAPDDVETSASSQSACFDYDFCPYLKSQQPVKYETPMTKNEKEIKKVKAEIKVLEKKLSFLEELSKTKTPVEEAYKRIYGMYPETYSDTWSAFQDGYDEAQKDYKVGEHQEPEGLKTLYDALELPYFTIGYHFNEGQKHWICKVVKEWMSQYTCDYVMCAEYLKGYEECLTVLEENLK